MSTNVVIPMPDRSTARSRVAAEVRAALARAQVSGNQLAGMLGQSQAYWSRRTTGKVPFDVDDLTAVADLLGVDVRSFFTDEEPRPASPDGAPGSSVRPKGFEPPTFWSGADDDVTCEDAAGDAVILLHPTWERALTDGALA